MPAAVDVPLALISLFGALHVLGEQRATRLLGRPRSRQERIARLRTSTAGLVVILIALASPIDTLADKLFWVHMIQHVLLLSVAAPLIVLGAPWNSIWRPLPLGFRRSLAEDDRPLALVPAAARARAAAGTADSGLDRLQCEPRRLAHPRSPTTLPWATARSTTSSTRRSCSSACCCGRR